MNATSPTDFELDPRLAADTHALGRLGRTRLLLMNNALVPWLILVPEVTVTELHELETDTQQDLLKDINRLSRFIKEHFAVHKINVAAIGNIVRQLHIHMVGRFETDVYWPGVVWGRTEKRPWSATEVKDLILALSRNLGPDFTPETPE